MIRLKIIGQTLLAAGICMLTVQGQASGRAAVEIQNDPSRAYDISVSSGQSDLNQASATLTLSGDNSRVSVEKQGSVTLVAGKSIILKPGTKVKAGGFLYASIEGRTPSGKHKSKVVAIVTIEEKQKIEEQASLAYAHARFSPFPAPGRKHIGTGAENQGSFSVSTTTLKAFFPEQQRKVAVEVPSVILTLATHSYRSPLQDNTLAVYRPEIGRVLRL